MTFIDITANRAEATKPRRTLLGMYPEEIEAVLAEWGEPKFRAKQLFQWMHKKAVFDYEQMTDLPSALRASLAEAHPITRAEELAHLQSIDGLTSKLLLKLDDGEQIEAVEMNTLPAGEAGGRKTICVSTQAGCAMGCVFCVTGQFGFFRNLEAGEVVQQVLRYSREGRAVTNVVYMGMGEPLANYDETVRSIRLLNHPMGLNLGARHITVSTSGLVPQIRKLAHEGLQINLAISLHAANDELRSSIMPVNRRWPIAELLDAAEEYQQVTGRRVSFEYTLISGVNDTPEVADELSSLLYGRGAHVNLIPLNANEDQGLHAPSMERAQAFTRRVNDLGVAATIRVNRGRDILAACGQLRLKEHHGAKARA